MESVASLPQVAAGTPIVRTEAAPSHAYRRYAVVLLAAVYMVNLIDRTAINTVGRALKQDLGLTNAQLGLLGGTAFAIFNAALGIPIARLAERRSRVAILSICLTIWSLMTVLCGVAGNYAQLFAARMGVGIGEAGGTAPAQSLIADLYGPERRASALAIFVLGVPAGTLVGAFAGAWAAATYGWRSAFLIVGGPGIALAIIMALTLREPTRGQSDAKPAGDEPPPLRIVLQTLLRHRSFLHMLAGGALVSMANNGVLLFLHSYLIDRFHVDYARGGLIVGLVSSIPIAIGYAGGGLLADALAGRDRRMPMWIAGFGCLIGGLIYSIALTRDTLPVAVACLSLPGLFTGAYYAPSFALANNLVDARMRNTSVAIVVLVFNLIGFGIGPTLVGAVSDLVTSTRLPAGESLAACSRVIESDACHAANAIGLQAGMLFSAAVFLWAGAHYLRASRFVRADLDRETAA